jgi:hypothetical protein
VARQPREEFVYVALASGGERPVITSPHDVAVSIMASRAAPRLSTLR